MVTQLQYAIVARCAIDEAEDTAAMMEVVCCWDAFRKELDRSKKIYGADVECEKLFVILTRLLFFSEIQFYWRRKLAQYKNSQNQFAKQAVDRANKLKKVWMEAMNKSSPA
uniref:Uncharacterized protein n=1 Tax=Lotharella globosa TaxID=91324 RepID=A0A7S3YTL6_9EUKA